MKNCLSFRKTFFAGNCLKRSQNHFGRNLKFSIFDPPHFGGRATLGSKCQMPLDSPWVVSNRCIIHYDAIFLTVSELYGLLKKIAGHRNTKMAVFGHRGPLGSKCSRRLDSPWGFPIDAKYIMMPHSLPFQSYMDFFKKTRWPSGGHIGWAIGPKLNSNLP